jgi:hypothetical protein
MFSASDSPTHDRAKGRRRGDDDESLGPRGLLHHQERDADGDRHDERADERKVTHGDPLRR